MARPSVDVVVPFRGAPAELERLRARLTALALEEGDSLVVVDNTPGGRSHQDGVRVVHAAELATPAYARNRGAALGEAEWIVFFDADVVPAPDLLALLFEPPPGQRCALLAGGVDDEPVPPDGPPAARYAYIRRAMSQENTFSFGSWAFAQTANAAVRRSAFEAAGGFRERLRAAEDADLTYRLQRAGWAIERRDAALVTHRNRQTVRSFVAQKLQHGAGAAWLYREYEGSFPGHRRSGLAWWALRTAAGRLARAARGRDRDIALWALFEPLELVAKELGRSLPNERPRLR